MTTTTTEKSPNQQEEQSVQEQTNVDLGSELTSTGLDTAGMETGFDRQEALSPQLTQDSNFDTYLTQSEVNEQIKALPGLDAAQQVALSESLHSMTAADQQAILQQLDQLANQGQLATPELTERRQELISNIVNEISGAKIHQGIKSTCTVTVFTSRLEKADPAEYSRLISELALNGEATMKGGATLTLPNSEAFGVDTGQGKFPGRSLSMDVLQTALMQKAAEYKDPSARYDDNLGVTISSQGNYSGLYQDQAQFISNQLFNTSSERVESSSVASNGVSQAELMKAVADGLESTAGGVPVELKWSADGAHMHHQLLVTEVRDGRVFFDNPWSAMSGQPPRQQEAGHLESMSIEDFQRRLVSATIDIPDTKFGDVAVKSVDTRGSYAPEATVDVEVSEGVTETITYEVEHTSPSLEFKIEQGEARLKYPHEEEVQAAKDDELKKEALRQQRAEEERKKSKKTNYFGEDDLMFS